MTLQLSGGGWEAVLAPKWGLLNQLPNLTFARDSIESVIEALF